MQTIICPNGVEMVIAPVVTGTDISVKFYIKMKTSGDLKLFYTLGLKQPDINQALTIDEQIKKYLNNGEG